MRKLKNDSFERDVSFFIIGKYNDKIIALIEKAAIIILLYDQRRIHLIECHQAKILV